MVAELTMKTVICVPAFNEENTIAKVVLGARQHSDLVIVCDDGSSDMTGEIAEHLGAIVIRHDRNMGKGEALRSLFRAARKANADVMVTIDADGQHDPRDIPRLASVVEKGEADIVIGSRFLSKNLIPSHRRFGNKLLNAVTSTDVTDTQSGLRAYNKAALDKIVPAEMGMGADSEILVEARRAGFKISEVPASVAYGTGRTSTHNPVFHTLDVMFTILKLTSIRHPMIFFGVPGSAFLLAGVYFIIRASESFQAYGITQLTLANGLLAFALSIFGALTLFTGIILFTVSTLIRKSMN